MMKRSVLRYWLLLFLPTVVIAVAAFRLLRYEQARIDASFQAAVEERARSVAQGLKQTVVAVQDTLLASLKKVDPPTATTTLPAWVKQNPLVRNVFVWLPGQGLRYPSPGQAGTREERRFVTRYATLFDGRHPWLTDQKRHGREAFLTQPALSSQEAKSPVRQAIKGRSGRESLLDLARHRNPLPNKIGGSTPAAVAFEGGWIPWFSDNRLYLLGWVRPVGRDLVWGVELELVTLLSRLITDFPRASSDAAVYLLKDGSGRILYQSGQVTPDERTGPDLVVSLAPVLPHWEVAVYSSRGQDGHMPGQGFLIISGLLVIMVIAAIFFGGILLYREAERNRRDAQRKTTFVTNVSHELKTPLTTIRMYAELLRDGRVKAAEKHGSYLQVIVDESRRLARLVNNLLDFGRLEEGRKQYRIESLDLTMFLKEFDRTHRIRIEKEGLALTITLPQESVPVDTDRDVVEQVLLNLVDNAVKYARSGQTLTIRLVSTDAGRSPHIQVLDRGPGIGPKYRQRIFENYFRGDDSLTAEHPGSGLGLSIARQLMRDLGGDLVYTPREGGGACFKIILNHQTKGE